MQAVKESRLRKNPAERFAGKEHLLNLSRASRDLRREPLPAQHGHRQTTLLKDGPVTLVLFVFEPNGELRDHQVEGWVTLQVLEGSLVLTTPRNSYNLCNGMIVALSRRVRHSIRALTQSRMLLSVHLAGEGRPGLAPGRVSREEC